MDMQEILSKVITSTNEIFEAEAGSVALLDEPGENIIIRAAVGAGADYVRGLSLPVGTGVIGWVVEQNTPALVPDVRYDRRFFREIDRSSGFFTESILCVPMKAQGHIIGCIELMNLHQRFLNEAGVKLLSVIADHAALAIENARLLAEAKVLQEVMVAAASTLDFDKVLSGTIEALHRTLGVERLGFFLPPENGEAVVPHPATIGFEFSNGSLPIPLDRSAIGWVIQHGKSLLIPDVRQFSPYYELSSETQSELCVPVVLNGKVAAVLNAESSQLSAFSQEDLRLFIAIAAELAVALENAQLFEKEHQLVRQQQALMDIFGDLIAEREPATLFQRIIERAIEVIPNADAGSLVIPSGEIFVFGAAVGFDLDQLKSISFSRENFLQHLPGPNKVQRLSHQAVVELGQKVIPDEFDKYAQVGRLSEIKATLRSMLRIGDTALGSLNVDSLSKANAFTEEDEQTLLLFASQASIAIQNARLFEEIRTAEAKYRDLFDNANDLILTLDSNFRISSANKVVPRTTGYRLEEIIGTHFSEFVTVEQRSKLYRLLKTRLGPAKAPATFEITVQGKDGRETVLEVTLRVQRIGRRPVAVQCIARDITQRLELEQQLRQTEKLSTIGKLVAGVAHELNNPLTSIIGYSDLLQEDDLHPRHKEDLEIIFRQADRARIIVKDLLTFARKIELETRPVDLNEVINSSLRLTKSDLQSHQIQVTTSLDFGLPLTMADPHQLELVFVNLITNAIQSLMAVEGPRGLSITSHYQDEIISLTFADNGPGIPPKIADRIFDPFFSTKPVGQGTGLGLSICFGIISEHKGRIKTEDHRPVGAAFCVELPVVPVEDPPLIRHPVLLEPPPAVQPSQLRVLVIDDEPSLLGLLERVLVRLGHQILTAGNGARAIEQLCQSHCDLVMCDVVMPDVLGPELYKRVIETHPYLVDRFIFMTGNIVDPDTRVFLEQSGLPWLAKPFLPVDVEQAIAQLLNFSSSPSPV
ncbi:MAG TPA: GAF domain-containing protein [Anaerolineae bacterium]|nr:GAF domain-containing protein [Anaerolineae bacterium]HMR62455.1 GAF domain-containing protein [Anaerolineae bacterium]